MRSLKSDGTDSPQGSDEFSASHNRPGHRLPAGQPDAAGFTVF
jgi:hypothetical protein